MDSQRYFPAWLGLKLPWLPTTCINYICFSIVWFLSMDVLCCRSLSLPLTPSVTLSLSFLSSSFSLSLPLMFFFISVPLSLPPLPISLPISPNLCQSFHVSMSPSIPPFVLPILPNIRLLPVIKTEKTILI